MAASTAGQGMAMSQNYHQHGPGCSHGASNMEKADEIDPNKAEVNPIFDAVKAGLLIPVQNFVEHYGPQVFAARDDKGHTPAHWACLGGHITILRFLLENKGLYDEPSLNELGARPIHWACVNGHIAAVDVLVQAGVALDVTDNKGCTPLIVCAQYGQTMLAGYLMGKGARLQLVDKDGDNALHWAAFKGHSELMRLLIYSGFNPRQQDNFGQTPLHLACINGNLVSVQELCEQDGAEINLADKNGKTPLMLAKGRKHEDVVDYLKIESKRKASILPRIDFWSIVFGPPGNHKGPLLFFVVNMLCWGYPMYVFKCLPETFYDMEVWHLIFLMVNVLMWVCLYHANSVDPGFLPRNIPEYDLAIKQVAHFDEWKQGKNPLSQLCHTCRTVKPLRSKHCKICNRCIKEFDHHCPYIYNCVGFNNRVWFCGFITCCFVNCLLSINFAIVLLYQGGWHWGVIIGLVELTFFTIIAFVITMYTFVHAAVNLTTNERINRARYKYLKNSSGKFYNPFNRGLKSNFLEYFHMKRPLATGELETVDFQRAKVGVVNQLSRADKS